MIRILVSAVAGILLTLALLASIGYSPPNAAADGPGRDSDSALLRAAFEGCEGKGTSKGWVELQGGAFRFECRPNVGLGPSVKRRTR